MQITNEAMKASSQVRNESIGETKMTLIVLRDTQPTAQTLVATS